MKDPSDVDKNIFFVPGTTRSYGKDYVSIRNSTGSEYYGV